MSTTLTQLFKQMYQIVKLMTKVRQIDPEIEYVRDDLLQKLSTLFTNVQKMKNIEVCVRTYQPSIKEKATHREIQVNTSVPSHAEKVTLLTIMFIQKQVTQIEKVKMTRVRQ